MVRVAYAVAAGRNERSGWKEGMAHAPGGGLHRLTRTSRRAVSNRACAATRLHRRFASPALKRLAFWCVKYRRGGCAL